MDHWDEGADADQQDQQIGKHDVIAIKQCHLQIDDPTGGPGFSDQPVDGQAEGTKNQGETNVNRHQSRTTLHTA